MSAQRRGLGNGEPLSHNGRSSDQSEEFFWCFFCPNALALAGLLTASLPPALEAGNGRRRVDGDIRCSLAKSCSTKK